MGFLDEFGHQVSLVFKRFPMLLVFGVSSFLVKTIFFTHLSLNLRIYPWQLVMEGHSGQKCNLIATCIPLDRIRVPLDRTFLPFDRTSIPLDRTSIPLDRTFIPFDRTFIPLHRTFLPFDRTSIILSLAI